MEIGFYVIGSVLIGVLVGFIANKLAGKNKLGLFTSIAVSLIGALAGSLILNLCRLNFDTLISAVLVGYVISIFVAGLSIIMAVRINKQQIDED